MFVILWEFRVKHDKLYEFRRAYGQDGDWDRLFKRAKGFVRTELLRDRDDRNRFVTVDTWESRRDYDEFRSTFDDEYMRTDSHTEAFTEAEARIGIFETDADV
jgi:heme-degrading monooxygenase HmoA